jgi:surfactin synthase thioesterase subunit
MNDLWAPYYRPRPDARVRLICLPYAGGSASVYHSWPDALPTDVDVCGVQLPGRETRIHEPPVAKMDQLVPMLLDALRPWFDLPFALFGHSMGALVGFEMARELRQRGERMPIHLFASGCHAPQYPDPAVVYDLPDAEFLDYLRSINGLSDAVLDNKELISMMLPMMRADAEVTETYTCQPIAPFGFPITAFAGLEDPMTTHAEVEGWRQHTTERFALAYFPGDHWFLQSARDEILQAVVKNLREDLRTQ